MLLLLLSLFSQLSTKEPEESNSVIFVSLIDSTWFNGLFTFYTVNWDEENTTTSSDEGTVNELCNSGISLTIFSRFSFDAFQTSVVPSITP